MPPPPAAAAVAAAVVVMAARAGRLDPAASARGRILGVYMPTHEREGAGKAGIFAAVGIDVCAGYQDAPHPDKPRLPPSAVIESPARPLLPGRPGLQLTPHRIRFTLFS